MQPRNGEALAGTLTQLIDQVDAGDEAAQAALCELIYNELLDIGRRARRRSPGCSMATTDVVHEFLERILVKGRLGQMKNRRYLYTAAAGQMHRILIDRWRQKRSKKHGGDRQREDLEPWLDELVDSTVSRCGGDLDALEAALALLKKERPRQFEIVQLRFFGGFTNEQIAKTLDVSVDTVKRDWRIARARLAAGLIDDS